MDRVNITLSKEGRKMSFDQFVKVFGKAYKMHPSIDLKSEYKRLTGKDADSGTGKKAKDVQP